MKHHRNIVVFFFFFAALVVLIITSGMYFSWRADQAISANADIKTTTTNSSSSLTSSPSSSATDILGKNFELLGETSTITFGEALAIADSVASTTKIEPAFLLAISQEELSLEKTDLCYLTDLKTGEGVRVSDGKDTPKTMKPGRDIPDFLIITKALGKDPLKTMVTCPMSFGWGGAMGPADFIPSTWMSYKDKIEKITGAPADPWNIKDAFLAAGLFLSDAGASSKTHNGEWNAAMIYFSGSADSGYNWYADGTLAIESKIKADIETLKTSEVKY